MHPSSPAGPAAAILLGLMVAGCEPAALGPPADVPLVRATVETEPVPQEGDAADDPAIWVDRADPARSLILGTQKKGGLYLYDLSGEVRQFLPAGRLNNVDLREDFAFPDAPAPLVAASNRTDNTVTLFRFDAGERLLRPDPVGRIETGFEEVYGVCLYRDPAGGTQVLATSKIGELRHWRLETRADGTVAGTLARELTLGSITEGCAFDDALGRLYVAEETVGLWRLPADPADPAPPELVDAVAPRGRIPADAEGVTILATGPESGYVLVSAQGESTYRAYRRTGENAYAGVFAIGGSADHGTDGVTHTDGIDVHAGPLGPAFPDGIFIAQDDENTGPAETQNFKFAPLGEILDILEPGAP